MRTLGNFIREALISFVVVSLVLLSIILVTEENGYAHVAESIQRSSLHCEGIKNPDSRHYCRALSIPSRTECEAIKDHDLRYQCRALVK